MIKAIIFDMDGLMFDTERPTLDAYEYAGEKMGRKGIGQMSIKCIGTTPAVTRQIMLDQLGEDFNYEQLDSYATDYLKELYKNSGVEAKPGLFQLLDYLKANGYKTAVASSSPEETIWKYLKQSKIETLFDAVVSGESVPRSKPHPDTFLKAAEALGVAPEHCMVLEDSRNGVLAGSRAGCKTVMVPDIWPGDEEIDKLLHAKVETLTDVIPLLAELKA